MNIKLKQTILVLALLVGIGGLFSGQLVFAAKCDGVDTAIISCDPAEGEGIEGTGFWSFLLQIINIMTIGVGVLAVGGIVYGAVLYSSAGGSSEQIKKAREIITNVVLGLVLYGLMYALINFLVPGGFLT
jgi:hypothetical protein